jgi:outer membrane biosynthesis protein TonB
MPLNKNHEFEELNGVKCGIVEKNVKPERVAFLKKLLEFNGFEVVSVPSPLSKVAATPTPKPQPEPQPQSDPQHQPQHEPQPQPQPPPPPETFTVGVTDYIFNPINAIFGRQLKTPGGHFVTLAYWNQEQATSNDEVPYFDNEATWK